MLGIMIELMAPAMFGSGEDLSTSREFTRMNTFALLGLADSSSGGRVCDRDLNRGRRVARHDTETLRMRW